MTIFVQNGVLTVRGANTDYYTLIQAQGTNLATLTVKNRPYTFQAVKKDGDTDTPLQGVKFALHRQVTVDNVTAIDVNPMKGYENLVTGKDGIIPKLNETLPAGTYELRELSAPKGYTLLSDYIRFTISPTGGIILLSAPDGVTLTEQKENGTLEYDLTIVNSQKKKVSFQKIDLNGSGLAGAVFDLHQTANSNGEEALQTPALYTNLTSGDDGLLKDSAGNTAFDLPVGNYQLVETAAPAGFNPLTEAVRIQVTASEIGMDGFNGVNCVVGNNGVYTITIPNSPGVELPSTGGRGTAMYRMVGALLVFGAVMIALKRRYSKMK